MILTNDEEIAKKNKLRRVPGPAGRAADACHRRQSRGPQGSAAARVQALRPAGRQQCPRPFGNADRAWPRRRLGRHRQPPDARRPASQERHRQQGDWGWARAYITCNKNGIPFDPEKPFVTSGIRLGTPAGTTRGFGEAEYREIGALIVEVLDDLREANSGEVTPPSKLSVRDKVVALTTLPDLRGLTPCAALYCGHDATRRSRTAGRPVRALSAAGASAAPAARRFTTFDACSCANSWW